MTTEFVQSRRNPPVLIPLAEPERLPREVVLQRITFIYCYVAKHRELDKVEEKELEILFSLAAGIHKPRRAKRGASPAEIQALEKDLLS